jgi:DNA polymerase IV
MTEPEFSFPIRKIIHVDMDAFYASVEQMDNPELRGKPVAVGGSSRGGVVSAASYEARKFGVRSAMSGIIAARCCPDLIFVRPRFDRYQEISKQIRAIFHDFTDDVEPLSLDEAFLDVTENKVEGKSASLIAQEIRARIKAEVGLNASAGISVNKFTAKIASDVNKPNGQCTIPPAKVLAFLEDLPIDKFFGVGQKTAIRMKQQSIFYGRDLKAKSLEELQKSFGNQAEHFYNIVRGIQRSRVSAHRERKSVAVERTFNTDIISRRAILEYLEKLSGMLATRLVKSEVKAKTLSIKWKYSDFSLHTKSHTVDFGFQTQLEIQQLAEEIFEQIEFEQPIRLLGLSTQKLYDPNDMNSETKPFDPQLSLDLEF